VNAVFTIAFILFPAPIIWLATKSKIVKNIGVVLICYIAGIVVGNAGILPESFVGARNLIQDVAVAVALPLLLFSLDVKKWFKLAKTGLICLLLALVSVIVTTFVLQLTLADKLEEGWKYAGMMAALYTGGTPNLAAMKTALGVSDDNYIVFHTYDTVVSLIYILFMSSVARVFFQKVFRLKPYKAAESGGDQEVSGISDESVESYGKIFHGPVILRLLLALLISGVIVAVSNFAGGLFEGNSMAVTILLITSLGIACSFIKPVRNIKHTFQAGMYIIYVFCFTVASMTKLSMLRNINWSVLLYVTIAIFGSLMIHALLCKLCKIDSDTMIITSVSALCSPPFVPGVAAALKNKNVLIGGLITGIIGYALGNYVGVGIATLFRTLFY